MLNKDLEDPAIKHVPGGIVFHPIGKRECINVVLAVKLSSSLLNVEGSYANEVTMLCDVSSSRVSIVIGGAMLNVDPSSLEVLGKPLVNLRSNLIQRLAFPSVFPEDEIFGLILPRGADDEIVIVSEAPSLGQCRHWPLAEPDPAVAEGAGKPSGVDNIDRKVRDPEPLSCGRADVSRVNQKGCVASEASSLPHGLEKFGLHEGRVLRDGNDGDVPSSDPYDPYQQGKRKEMAGFGSR